jgi:hypothetical protein
MIHVSYILETSQTGRKYIWWLDKSTQDCTQKSKIVFWNSDVTIRLMHAWHGVMLTLQTMPQKYKWNTLSLWELFITIKEL